MDKLRDIRRTVHEKLLSLRTIDRIVGSDEFAELFAKCSEPEQLAAEQLTNSGDRLGLETWLEKQRKEFDFAALSIRELRQLGSKLGVRNYNRIPKALLLSEIHNASQRNRQELSSIDREDYSPIGCCGDPVGSNQSILNGLGQKV